MARDTPSWNLLIQKIANRQVVQVDQEGHHHQGSNVARRTEPMQTSLSETQRHRMTHRFCEWMKCWLGQTMKSQRPAQQMMVRDTDVDNINSRWWQIASCKDDVDGATSIVCSTSNVLDEALTLQDVDEFDGGCVESTLEINVDVPRQRERVTKRRQVV